MGGKSSKPGRVAFDPNAPPPLECSKDSVTFTPQGDSVDINVDLWDEFRVKNVSTRKEKFVMEQIQNKNCSLEFFPPAGSLARGKTKLVKVRLVVFQPANLNFQFRAMTPDGRSVFMQLRVQCENGVFGVDPDTMEMTQDGSHTVPKILVDMKNNLGINNGFVQEGIFRLAGERTEIDQVKQLMNAKRFDYQNELDPNCMASLIKIWFRDLPTPILNHVDKDTLLDIHDPDECVEVFRNLPNSAKAVMSWLLDLMAYTSSFSQTNKMTPTNIAICVAPNLYDISTPNPMEGLILSQKCAIFMTNVLSARVNGEL